MNTISIDVQGAKATELTAIIKHSEREVGSKHSNKSIQSDKIKDNITLVSARDDNGSLKGLKNDVLGTIDYVRKQNGHNRALRKDANIMTTVVVTPGGDITGNQEQCIEFLKQAHTFLEERYNGAIVSSVIHLDETTPHLHYSFIPWTEDGNLSQKKVIGGRQGLRDLHSSMRDYMNTYQPEWNFVKKQGTVNGVDMDTYKAMKEREDDLNRQNEVLLARETELNDREIQIKLKEAKNTLKTSELDKREKELDNKAVELHNIQLQIQNERTELDSYVDELERYVDEVDEHLQNNNDKLVIQHVKKRGVYDKILNEATKTRTKQVITARSLLNGYQQKKRDDKSRDYDSI